MPPIDEEKVLAELAAVRAQLADLVVRFSYMNDHEARIRALENSISRSAWLPVIVTSLLMSGLGAIIVRIIDVGL
jgi:hypothetical protein